MSHVSYITHALNLSQNKEPDDDDDDIIIIIIIKQNARLKLKRYKSYASSAERTGRQALQSTPVLRRNGIPRLWSTVMEVIDAVEVHVLGVPAERCLPHPEIQVSRVDAFDRHGVVGADVIQDRTEAVYVPDVLLFVVKASGNVGAVDRRVEGHVLPEFPLQLVEVTVTRGAMTWNFKKNRK